MGYDYDKDNVDEMTLALLYLGATGDKRGAPGLEDLRRGHHGPAS